MAVNGVCLSSGGGSSQWVTNGSDIYFTGGNVGIGIDSPLDNFVVAGTATVLGTLKIDSFPIVTDFNSSSLFAGFDSGLGATDTTRSNFIGPSSGQDAVGVTDSNFLGYQSGLGASSASYSNFLGMSAGINAAGSGASNFFGAYAGSSADQSMNSNFFGYNAGYAASATPNANFFGYNAGADAAGAANSNFLGYQSGYGAYLANNSNFFGESAGEGSYLSYASNFFGWSAGAGTHASYSNFIGYQAGNGAIDASNSIFIGNQSGNGDTVNNSAVGKSSILIGNFTSTGGFSDSIAIGQGTANSAANQLNIGRVLYATGINSATTPSAAPEAGGKVGIGTSTPTAQLHTTGTVRFSTFGAGTLQTDASGNLTVSSDENLKDIKSAFTRGLSDIIKINPITYKWNAVSGLDQSTEYSGFSAQNIQSSIPEAVSENPNGFLALQDRPIIAALVNAVKELNVKVDAKNNSVSTIVGSNSLISVFTDWVVEGGKVVLGVFDNVKVNNSLEIKGDNGCMYKVKVGVDGKVYSTPVDEACSVNQTLTTTLTPNPSPSAPTEPVASSTPEVVATEELATSTESVTTTADEPVENPAPDDTQTQTGSDSTESTSTQNVEPTP